MKNIVIALAVIVGVTSYALTAEGQSGTYSVSDLGSLSGGNAVGRQVDNIYRRIAGSSGRAHGSNTHAFSWTAQHGMTDLGVLEGGDRSDAFAVNDAGDVVGDSNNAKSLRAVMWSRTGDMRELGTLPGDNS